MELEPIVLDDNLLKQLVTKKFKPIVLTKMEKTASNHPLLLLNFNRGVIDERMSFSLLGLPIQNIYVFENDKSQFCTFLIIEIQRTEFDKFVQAWGYPENVLEKDYLVGDFDFLYWSKNGFEIFINRHHSSINKKSKYIIQILNMNYREIMDLSKIE